MEGRWTLLSQGEKDEDQDFLAGWVQVAAANPKY